MTAQIHTPGQGIDFAELLRRESIAPPVQPKQAILPGRPHPVSPPDFRALAPLPILLAGQGIKIEYQQGLEYWTPYGLLNISPQLNHWLRRYEAGSALADAVLNIEWPKGHQRGRITLDAD